MSILPGCIRVVGNRLTESTETVAKIYYYDDNGNITSDGTRTFVYNQNNRLIRAEEGTTVPGEYFYDAFGRRVKKIASGVTTLYHYDIAGNLIAETEADGTPLRDIVYLNGERVAMKLYGFQAGCFLSMITSARRRKSLIRQVRLCGRGFTCPSARRGRILLRL